MISMILPIAAGNALRLFVEPPADAAEWRILRKGSDSFSGHDDSSALVVYRGSDRIVVDDQHLQNDSPAFYRPYYWIDGSWQEGSGLSGTPRATYEDLSTDALSVFTDRMEAFLRVECERGSFVTDVGYVPVYTAPPSLERDIPFPVVSVHLTNEDRAVSGVGEDLGGDDFDSISGSWEESEGWMASVQLTVMGWSLNPDERRELRKAMRRAVVANLPVFDSHGMIQIEFNQQDVDAVSGEYGAPVYQVMGTFTCLAPIRVGHKVDAITDVEVRSTNG